MSVSRAASASSAQPMIALTNISLSMPSRAGTVDILNNVTVKINAGETVAVLGPSGAGKTTAMMVMAGLEGVTKGQVVVAGHDLNALDEDRLAEIRRDHIGIIFQAFRLIPSMTALENVAIPLELEGAKDAFERAQVALTDVGLGHRIDHFPDQLSGGEQQRVAIARAIVTGPDILLADEPTGNLDQATGGEIMDLLMETAAKHGTSLVLITHDEALATRLSRIIRIADGAISEDRKTTPAKKAPAKKTSAKKTTKKKA
ncbi:MAG: ABC transporter ATP-binding protein [Alphaproteobacteria bacterium]|nr:ABC transporter ATP-binding protein [Alphaproteobacteria bacterium]